MSDTAVQLSLFPRESGDILAFMPRFAAIDFGPPDSWCNCQRCRYSRATEAIRNGTMSVAEFEPLYWEILARAYRPSKIIDSWSRLAILAWEFK